MERIIGKSSESPLLATTTDCSTRGLETGRSLRLPEAWCLTILYHPDLHRIGARFRWSAAPGPVVQLSRIAPLFRSAMDPEVLPIGLPAVSRSPLRLLNVENGIVLMPENERVVFEVGSRPGRPGEVLPLQALRSGVVLTLGRRVYVMLQGSQSLTVSSASELGLLGVSDAISHLRQEIERLARLSVPVLLTGESGVGKELVARALHARSPRAAQPFIAVNMSALPASMAAAELFGHARGAFTGAVEARAGLFGQAEGGTLFLDEVGETPAEIQPMLLRAIETREIQRLGAVPRTIDLRIIAATDSDLEALVAAGKFRAPLLYRLRAATLEVPPLRERRSDIPVLLLKFLREALMELGSSQLLEPDPAREHPWLRMSALVNLLSYRWPGNVRELRNVAYEIALDCHARPFAAIPEWLEERLETSVEGGETPDTTAGPGLPERRTPAPSSPVAVDPPAGSGGPLVGIDRTLLLQALEANDWRIGTTAQSLGLSKGALYQRMEQFGIRHAGQLSREQIEEASEQNGGRDAARLARTLQVSLRGLKLRMRVLGLEI